MLKKWTLWAPLVVGISICVALACRIGDPFGANLGSFVQAASTVILVAVTFAYVFATYDMATAANAQLNLTQTEPERQALYEVWQEYVAVRRDVVSLDPLIRVTLLDAMHDPNSLPRSLTDLRQCASSADSLVGKIHSLEVRFPVNARRRIMVVSYSWNSLAQVGLEWADFLHVQQNRSIDTPEPMTKASLKTAWDAKVDVGPSGHPSWEMLFDRDRAAELLDLNLEFDDVVRESLGKWQQS